MDKFYSTTQMASLIGVSPSTLKRWAKNEKLVPEAVTTGGHRCYSHHQYLKHCQDNAIDPSSRVIVGFARGHRLFCDKSESSISSHYPGSFTIFDIPGAHCGDAIGELMDGVKCNEFSNVVLPDDECISPSEYKLLASACRKVSCALTRLK